MLSPSSISKRYLLRGAVISRRTRPRHLSGSRPGTWHDLQHCSKRVTNLRRSRCRPVTKRYDWEEKRKPAKFDVHLNHLLPEHPSGTVRTTNLERLCPARSACHVQRANRGPSPRTHVPPHDGFSPETFPPRFRYPCPSPDPGSHTPTPQAKKGATTLHHLPSRSRREGEGGFKTIKPASLGWGREMLPWEWRDNPHLASPWESGKPSLGGTTTTSLQRVGV